MFRHLKIKWEAWRWRRYKVWNSPFFQTHSWHSIKIFGIPSNTLIAFYQTLLLVILLNTSFSLFVLPICTQIFIEYLVSRVIYLPCLITSVLMLLWKRIHDAISSCWELSELALWKEVSSRVLRRQTHDPQCCQFEGHLFKSLRLILEITSCWYLTWN